MLGKATEINTPIHKVTFIHVKPFKATSGATIVVKTTIAADLLKLIFPVFSEINEINPPLLPNNFLIFP